MQHQPEGTPVGPVGLFVGDMVGFFVGLRDVGLRVVGLPVGVAVSVGLVVGLFVSPRTVGLTVGAGDGGGREGGDVGAGFTYSSPARQRWHLVRSS